MEKPTEIHHNSGVSPVCANYDGFVWVFPRKVVRIRMNSRNALYNAPAKKVSNNVFGDTLGECHSPDTSGLNQQGARLRGRTATQRSKKGSEKVLGRVLGKDSQKGSEKGVC